ncbi:MAG: hypothetical protein JW727_00130 [Candidatus Aenigmarchaeota archaeon]|nr:hypothetical protein [Candidatus Aenigmarchaeota archaeon]
MGFGISHGELPETAQNLVVMTTIGHDENFVVGSSIDVLCFGERIGIDDSEGLAVATGPSKIQFTPTESGSYTVFCGKESRTFFVLGLEGSEEKAESVSVISKDSSVEPKSAPEVLSQETSETSMGLENSKKVFSQEILSAQDLPAGASEVASRTPFAQDNGSIVRFSSKLKDIGINVTLKYSGQAPEIEVSKWQGEGRAVLRVGSELSAKVHKNLSGTSMFEFNSSGLVNQFYAVDEGEGTFKWNMVLDKKPAQDNWSYEVILEGIECYYQQPLVQEINCTLAGCAACNETDCWGESGEILIHRPEDVVGTYACYGSQKGDYSAIGGKNYATGKAFDIKRPLFIDANNKTYLGTVSFLESTLTVTGDRDWLESAAYPVVVDPTFGYTTAGGSYTTVGTNAFYGLIATPPANLAVDYLRFYGRNAASIKGVITADLGTYAIVPNGVSSTNTSTNTIIWYNLYYSSKPLLSSGNHYLIGIIPSANERFYYDTGIQTNSSYDTANSYATPQDLGAVTTSTNLYSIYATYTLYISSLRINTPANDSFTNQTNPSVNFTVQGGSLNYNCTWQLNGTRKGYNGSVSNNTATLMLNSTALSEGPYAGNVTCQNSTVVMSGLYNFTLDSIIPQVSISSPQNSTYTNLTELDFIYEVSESNINLTNVSIYNSTGSIVNSTTNSSTGTVHSYLAVYKDGVYTFNVTGYDKAGNINQSRGNFTRDTSTPQVSIISPINSTWTNQTLLDFSYLVSDENLNLTNLSVYNSTGHIVNSTANSSTGTAHSCLSVYADGYYVWNATTCDKAGNCNQSRGNFTRDALAPGIAPAYPADNTYTNDTQIWVVAAITEGNLNTTNLSIYNSTGALVNSTANMSTGEVNFYASFYADDWYNLTLISYDYAYNVYSKSIQNVTLDREIPQVSIISPETNSSVTSRQVDITLSVTETNINLTNCTIVSAAGEALNSTLNTSTGTVHCYLTLYQDANVNITVTTYDKAGNINSTLKSNITVDEAKPQYSNVQQSPTGNPDYGLEVQCNATWTDNVGLSLVYLRSNFSGSWQDYEPLSNGDEYYYTIPISELTGLEEVGWYFWANDTSNNINNTMPIQAFTVQKATPELSLYLNGTEGDRNYSRNEYANLTAALSVSGEIVELWANFTGGAASLLDLGPSPLQNITYLDYTPGYYQVKANFSGNENYTASDSEHLLGIFPEPPTINLQQPINRSGDTDGTVVFYYNVSSPVAVSSCKLIINGSVNQTNSSINVGETQNFTVNGLEVGKYNWSINCTNSWGMKNNSETREFSIIVMSSFGGLTTDISGQDVSDLALFTLEREGYGKIVFNETVDLSGGSDLESNVSIGLGYIFVNSSGEPRINKSATLSLYGLSYLFPPVVLSGGELCSGCVPESYTSNTFVFNVSHFTNYSAGANSNLTIFDSTDPEGGEHTVFAGDQAIFYAGYTNATTGEPIVGGEAYCEIRFSDLVKNMTYNSTSMLYEYNRSFEVSGNYPWNITCNGSSLGFEALNSTDAVSIGSPYLEVYLMIPPSVEGQGDATEDGGYLVGQNRTFVIKANVTCRAGDCGIVTGFVRYNHSSESPDANLSTFPDTPFYVVNSTSGSAQNPVSCGMLNEGDSCTLNWTINATGNLNSLWKIDSGFNSTNSINHTSSATIRIVKVILLSLSFTEVDFGVVNPATSGDQNPSPNNGNQKVMVHVNSNDVENLWIKGTNLTPEKISGYGNVTYSIGVGNITWNTEAEYSSSKKLSSEYQNIMSNLKSGENQSMYFWITAPRGLEAQKYSGKLYILANATS